jgi:RND superfamily putative drug exporter
MALVLDAGSVAASFGLLVLLFRFGAGAVVGLYHVPQVEGWVPVFLFAMLFGLSMDYEVFLVSRMREAWDRGADNPSAVAEGLSQTGRVVTAAALIMVGRSLASEAGASPVCRSSVPASLSGPWWTQPSCVGCSCRA